MSDIKKRYEELMRLRELKKSQDMYQPTEDTKKAESSIRSAFGIPQRDEEDEENKKPGFFANLKKMMGK